MTYLSGQVVQAVDMAGDMVASWKVTPSVLTVTTERDVLSNSWTPPAIGCYLIRGHIPYDVSATGTDAKMRLKVGGTEIDYDLRPGIAGVFVARMRCEETINITSLAAVIVKSTIERGAGAATLNSRLVEARIEIFRTGDIGVRA